MSRQKKLFKNTLVLSIGTFLPKISAMLVLPIITGALTKNEYAIYDLINILVSLFLPIVTMQIQTAAFRFLIEARNNSNERKSIITNIFVFVTPIALICFFIIFAFLRNTSTLNRLLIATYFIVDIFTNIVKQICRGLSKNKAFSISAIIGSTLNLLLSVVLISFLNLKLTGCIICLLISALIQMVILSRKIQIWKYFDKSLIDLSVIKKLLAYSWPMIPNGISMWIVNVSDRLVISFVLGLEATAVYAVANKLPNLLTTFQSTFTMAWQENASLVSKDDDANQYYSAMFDGIFSLMASATAILISITPILFRIFIKGDYADAYIQISTLFLGTFFYSMCSFIGGIYVAFMKSKEVGISTTFAAICNFVINISTIRFVGLYAASLSTLISYVILFIYRSKNIKKFVNLKYYNNKNAIIIFILIILCISNAKQMFILDIINVIISIILSIVVNYKLIYTIFYKFFHVR